MLYGAGLCIAGRGPLMSGPVSAASSVSVIVLSYNQEAFVAQAVRAVLAQEGPPIDILISDDCSSDGTFEAIKSATEGYDGPHRITVRRNEANIGLVAHINQAVELTTGEIIIPAYGDDISEPTRVAEIIAAFRESNALLVHSDAMAVDENDQPTPSHYRKADFYRTTDPLTAATSMALYLGAAGAWHRDLFRKYGPLKFPNVYDDHVLGFRAALEGRVAFVEKPLLKYREGVGLSHRLKQDRSADTAAARRQKILAQRVAAFRQRLADTETFGLQATHPIARKLSTAIQDAEMRLACHDGVFRMILRNLNRPSAALKAALSEGLRMMRRK